MRKSLEKRISEVDNAETRSSFLDALSKRNYHIPKRESDIIDREKYVMIRDINSYLNEPNMDSDRKLSRKLNKKLVQQVQYGILCLRAEIPEEIMSQLTYWEKVCIFPGLWGARKEQKGSLAKVVKTYVQHGYERLNSMRDGKLIIPGMKPKQTVLEIETKERLRPLMRLLNKEKKQPSEDLSHEISMMLDSCTPEDLRFLGKRYGTKALGEYSP